MKKIIASIIGLALTLGTLNASDVGVNFSATLNKDGLVTSYSEDFGFDVSQAGVDQVTIGPLAGAVTTNITFSKLDDPYLVKVEVSVTTDTEQEVKFGIQGATNDFRRMFILKEGHAAMIPLDTNVTFQANWPANETNTITAIGYER